MEEKLQAIVLNTIRHSDRNNVMTVYTPTRGRMVFLVPAGGGKSARRRNAQLMPLSIVEITASIRQGREMHPFSSVAPMVVYNDLYFNPMKNFVGIFIAEFLNHLLRDTLPDRQMWNFIANALQILDKTTRSIANFHIVFLYTLTSFCGIAPDIRSYRNNAFFDMQAGTYTQTIPMHKNYLHSHQARLPLLLDRINFVNMHRFRLSRQERVQIIEGLLRYYEIHIPGFKSLHSLDILRQLLD